MIAYKFLRPGRVAPFTGFQWQQGEWAGVDGRPLLCGRGVHACRPGDLPYWINRELWEIELAGLVVEGQRKVLAQRGRLLRPIEAWNAAAEAEFARACAARSRAFADAIPDDAELGAVAEDAEAYAATGLAHVVQYVAAVAADRAGGPEGRLAERQAQATWLAENVL